MDNDKRTHPNGRRDMDNLKVVNTDEALTLDELRELKRLAQLSKTSRTVAIAVMALVSIVGLPAIIQWAGKHVNW
jgi:hypothetical protein